MKEDDSILLSIFQLIYTVVTLQNIFCISEVLLFDGVVYEFKFTESLTE